MHSDANNNVQSIVLCLIISRRFIEMLLSSLNQGGWDGRGM
jgi:hypothetical protein